MKYIHGVEAMKSREKVCDWCHNPFIDKSKGNWCRTCSKNCRNQLRTQNMRKGGAFEWDEERRKKIGEITKQNLLSGKVENPWSRNEVKEKIRQTNLKKFGVSNWRQTKEGRERTITFNKKRIRSREERRKHSDNARKQMKGGLKSRGKAGKRDDLPGFYRSSWEANYARILIHQGKSWLYEPKTFELASGISYTPDFYVDGCFIEIKGWMDDRSKRQLDEFTIEYPNERLQIVGPKEYYSLRQQYASLIKEWE